MAFETKEQILEKMISQKTPMCPHCDQKMNIWEVPPISFSDGLGWGTPYLYLCFNDDCPLYLQGWENLRENYGRNASYRCMRYPDNENFECLPVFSPMGATGQIVDEEIAAHEEAVKEATKMGFCSLAESYTEKDWNTVLTMTLDSSWPIQVRLKAAEMIADIGEPGAIEPLRNATFGNKDLMNTVDASIRNIHERFFTRECPFCAEIIKKRAKVCKHCGRDVAGQ